MHSWCGFARPSGSTATASPPHTRPAPLTPKRCHRRRTRSVGRPSAVASQPLHGQHAEPVGGRARPPEAKGSREGPVGIDVVVEGEVLAQLGQTGP